MYHSVLASALDALTTQFARVIDAFQTLLHYSPYWGPFVFAPIFWHAWIRYVRTRFISEQEHVLLELIFPEEIHKSPAAMQAVFDGLWQKGGEATFIDRMWAGKVRMWYSFEYASNEGHIHMYVWTRAPFRGMVERTFYAHYPDIEIREAEDYACSFPFSLDTHDAYGLDFNISAPIGVPIKTYVDYHLDQPTTKEEQKVDPITHIFEFLGSLGKGEYMWIQILARASKKEDVTFGPFRNICSYEELAQMEITRIRNSPEETIVFPDGGMGKVLSDKQLQRIKAMNRIATSGTHWDVGIRSIYIAEHDHFNWTNIPGMITMWQPFGAPGYNNIVIEGSRWQPMLNYPWQDFNNIRANKKKVQIIDAYRRRSWFHFPYRFRHFMLTSEELATIFHIPGSVAKTPTIHRIESARHEPPSNLPT